MVIQCTCDCNCSDRDTARSSCLPRLQQQRATPTSSLTPTPTTPLNGGNDMENRFPYYRRLSNTSSALYGSCPQLQLPHHQQQQHQQHQQQQQQKQQQQPLPQTCHSHGLSLGLRHHQQHNNNNNNNDEEQLQRQYSSLVRPAKHRGSVLCNKCAL
ncbi:myb-like protein AA [Drosophila albomicans]|uniref:Myb-like protein AA n=1 Tax=Drosophila albomicans TaxID=7291 RepID=A0A9C6SZ19_DROAB|nr:myb-like protein AA [Drosophila albomicans]